MELPLMSDCPENEPALCSDIETLLHRQYEALLRDDLQTVEQTGEEILRIAAGLSEQQKVELSSRMEQIWLMHENMLAMLSAKKQMVDAELAAVRQKRNLNRSYGKNNE